MEHSEQFCPQNYSEISEEQYGLPKKQQKYISGPNNGIWTDLQHTKYIVFMEFHKEKMRSKEKRRSSKLYKSMSQYIGTRNALQCRSHHQKLEEKYIYPNKIISNFKQHNDLTLYNELRQELEVQNGGSSSKVVSNLKPQETGLRNEPLNQANTVEKGNQAQDQSTPTSPSSVTNVQVNSSFRPFMAEQWMQPTVYNWCPYGMYPMFSMF